jgi:holo-[acyl-carrier protein] synthase
MRIVGHGIDIVEVSRIAEMLENHADRFLERCFTAREVAYCRADRRTHERLAGRFAAKEAALKALGTGLRDGMSWTDFEVVMLPSGQPTLTVSGRAAATATALWIDSWTISISHTTSYAVASTIATDSR